MQSFQQHQQSFCEALLLSATQRTSGGECPRLLLRILLPVHSLARLAVFSVGVVKLMVCQHHPECSLSKMLPFTCVKVLPGLWGPHDRNIDPRSRR